jgi:hypothetical protein
MALIGYCAGVRLSAEIKTFIGPVSPVKVFILSGRGIGWHSSSEKTLDTTEKLKILSQDSRYDLACACATRDDEHRRRSRDDKWIYPVVLPAAARPICSKHFFLTSASIIANIAL